MSFEAWCALAGVLLVGMALVPKLIARLPLTTAAIYLVIGLICGPLFFNVIRVQPLDYTQLLERLTEIAVIISLFAAGLKLRLPLDDPKWFIPLRLAFVSMTLTVGLITLVGVYLLHLPLGAAVLLGAILSPTDPVLASDVSVLHSHDDDPLRFSLTAEAGLNDGTAFPFVMLGLGLLGLHDLGEGGWKWFSVDVLWSIGAGLGIGALLGTLTARLVLWLRREKNEAVGTDDFLTLGLIAAAYGIALLLHSYGFLAVFAAGLALRHTERSITDKMPEPKEDEKTMPIPETDQEAEEIRDELATNEKTSSKFLMGQLLRYNEALERLAEFALVLLLGGMISRATWTKSALWLAPLLFLIIRPISVWLGLLGARETGKSRPYIAWFVIRGLGSLFYLFYAIEHDLPAALAAQFTAITFSVVALSIVAHGLTVTLSMKKYEKISQ